jgi:hypothetical protein
MANANNLMNPGRNIVHHNRSVTVDANRKGVMWALIAFLILGIFGAAYWVMTQRQTLNVSSPQAAGKIDRPFNSGVFPASESTPVNQ